MNSSDNSVDNFESWPDPLPLPGLLSVASFDFELLPNTLRPWAEDIVERIQCPADYVGVSVMTALGSVIGRQVGIRPQSQSDWTVIVNMWSILVGRPGVLKTPAMIQSLSHISQLSAKANESYQLLIKDHSLSVKISKFKADENEKAARKAYAKDANIDLSKLLIDEYIVAPEMRRFITNDSTAAALGELLRQNPNGILVFRDELISLLKSLDREDNIEARGFYLTGWNGDCSYTFDRIGRGMNLHIPGVCLSILGSTQPGRIAEYVRSTIRGGADDGLLQRFGLTVWPDITGEWRNVDRWPDCDAKRQAFEIFEYLSKLETSVILAQQDFDHDGKASGLPYLRLDPAALDMFVTWRTELENRLRTSELPLAMESHLSKYRKLVPGLSLIIHLANKKTDQFQKKLSLRR